MSRFISGPHDLNIPYQVSKFLLNLLIEKLSGRVGQKEGSFIWKNDKDFEFSIRQLEATLPTHGNFGGPGYSCGQRGEFSPEEIEKFPVARIYDPKTGKERNDYVDTLAKAHDLAYAKAKGKPDYWELIRQADEELVRGLKELRDGTSPLYSDGGKMTTAESAYASSMLDLFKMTIAMRDEPLAAFEKLKNAGYGADQMNGLIDAISNGLNSMDLRSLLRKLHLSENEVQETEQKVYAYCQQNGLDSGSILRADTTATGTNTLEIASAANPRPDEPIDEDQDYYYGPGMG
jgi:hypothetical protein